jgi:hypothetical protein
VDSWRNPRHGLIVPNQRWDSTSVDTGDATREKTKDYLHNKYKVIKVVRTEQFYLKATKYLSRKVKMLR